TPVRPSKDQAMSTNRPSAEDLDYEDKRLHRLGIDPNGEPVVIMIPMRERQEEFERHGGGPRPHPTPEPPQTSMPGAMHNCARAGAKQFGSAGVRSMISSTASLSRRSMRWLSSGTIWSSSPTSLTPCFCFLRSSVTRPPLWLSAWRTSLAMLISGWNQHASAM